MQDLYAENYKILPREFKDLNKQRDAWSPLAGDLAVYKCLPAVICGFGVTRVIISAYPGHATGLADPKQSLKEQQSERT